MKPTLAQKARYRTEKSKLAAIIQSQRVAEEIERAEEYMYNRIAEHYFRAAIRIVNRSAKQGYCECYLCYSKVVSSFYYTFICDTYNVLVVERIKHKLILEGFRVSTFPNDLDIRIEW